MICIIYVIIINCLHSFSFLTFVFFHSFICVRVLYLFIDITRNINSCEYFQSSKKRFRRSKSFKVCGINLLRVSVLIYLQRLNNKKSTSLVSLILNLRLFLRRAIIHKYVFNATSCIALVGSINVLSSTIS